MGVQFYIPCERPLNDVVKCFWQSIRENTNFRQETIIPKGVVEMVFNFLPETTFHGLLYNKKYFMPKCFIQGYHNSKIELNLPEKQSLFGIVLQTTATKQILHVPAGKLARQCIDLTLIDNTFCSLWHQLAEKKMFQDRITIFSNWLTKRITCLTAREQILNNLFSLNTKNNFSISNLSEWLCYSPRHLSRVFYEQTGMNTEQTLLYLKYLKSLQLIHYSDLSLTQIAYVCGFSDQSHFIKTFKLFTSLTPKEYQHHKSNLMGHYFKHVR